MGAELFLHVGPDRVGALGEEVGLIVDDTVQDFVAEVAHPDFVEVGERQADAALHGFPVLAHLSLLTAEILGGSAYAIDEWGVRMFLHRRGFRHGA